MYSYKYPHPAITTDSVVFGFDGRAMHVLLIERGIEPFKGDWALPGGFMRIDETVEQCARRELREETNVKDVFLEQFHVFSNPGRDPRERVVTVAFLALVRQSDYRLIAGDDAVNACWFEIDELPPLAFDHHEIIKLARERLQEVLRTRPVAFRLLDRTFSMPELQRIYETINETTYDRRNFAKKMSSTGLLRCISDDNIDNLCCESDGVIEGTIEYDQCPTKPTCRNEVSANSISPRRRHQNLYSFDEERYIAEQAPAKKKRRFPFNF